MRAFILICHALAMKRLAKRRRCAFGAPLHTDRGRNSPKVFP